MSFLFSSSVKNVDGQHSLIDTAQLIELIENPPEYECDYKQAKAKACCIGAHDLETSKRKDPVLKHNNFTLLRLDLDDNAPSIDEIEENLRGLNLSRFFIYSTAKHQQIDVETGEDYGNRFRVLIPLKNGIEYKLWLVTQVGLSLPFEADGCADRPQQIMFLPVRYTGDSYEFKIVDEGDNKLRKLSDAGIEQTRSDNKDFKENDLQYKKKTYTEKLTGNQVSIIDMFNRQFTVGDVLRQFDYECKGDRWLSPFSASGVAGGVILTSNKDGKHRYYTHSESEKNHLGLKKGKAFDAFDMYSYLNCGGDDYEAVKDVATNIFPEVDKHNKREFVVSKQNAKLAETSALLDDITKQGAEVVA